MSWGAVTGEDRHTGGTGGSRGSRRGCWEGVPCGVPASGQRKFPLEELLLRGPGVQAEECAGTWGPRRYQGHSHKPVLELGERTGVGGGDGMKGVGKRPQKPVCKGQIGWQNLPPGSSRAPGPGRPPRASSCGSPRPTWAGGSRGGSRAPGVMGLPGRGRSDGSTSAFYVLALSDPDYHSADTTGPPPRQSVEGAVTVARTL